MTVLAPGSGGPGGARGSLRAAPLSAPAPLLRGSAPHYEAPPAALGSGATNDGSARGRDGWGARFLCEWEEGK